jgi:hypothetical protein
VLKKPKSALADNPTNAVGGGWTFEANPNGIASYSPRLPYSATLGRRSAMGPNPNGVARLAPGVMNNERRGAA